jgi:hypothetical protein
MTTTTDLVDRYIALWNDPDPAARHRAVRDLWAPGGRQVLQPPAELRDRAAALGFPAATLEVRGHAELDIRVTRAYEEFIAPGAFAFRRRSDPVRLQDAVTFTWEMVPVAGGGAQGIGRDVLLLDADDRIRVDYQFIEG